MQPIATMLRSVPGFAELDEAALEHVAAAGDLAEVEAGDVLFREGALPKSLYVLLDGTVSLTGTAADASSTVIDILGPASSFVLANVLADEPYLMGAEAVSNASVVRIAAEAMRDVVATQPAAAIAMMRAMSAELGNMTRQIVDLKVRVAAHRLGTFLLSQVKEPTATSADFRLPVTKGLLAPWLGCRAENLSRAFMALRAYGVETHGSRVTLHDVARLKTYVGLSDSVRPEVVTLREPVEKVLGDAFRLRRREKRR
jgi:CRP/FNR family transcriptional regulator, transcriptional activator FtrB